MIRPSFRMTEDSALPDEMYRDIFLALPWLGVWWHWRRVCRGWRDLLDRLDWSTCTVLRTVDTDGSIYLRLASDNTTVHLIRISDGYWSLWDHVTGFLLQVWGQWEPHFLNANWFRREDTTTTHEDINLGSYVVAVNPRKLPPRTQSTIIYDDFAHFVGAMIEWIAYGIYGQRYVVDAMEATRTGVWRRLVRFMHCPPIKRALMDHYVKNVKQI